MLIFNLVILQVISTSYCYDLELEGVVRIGKDFLKTLSKHSEFAKKLNLPSSFASKGKLPKKVLSSAVMRAILDKNMIKLNTTVTKSTDSMQQFVNYLQKKGKFSLNNIANQITTDLNIKKNITSILDTVSNDYVTMIQNYYDFINENRTDTFIDTEFAYLDIVETSSRLLYSEERKLLNEIIMDENLSSINNSVQTMNENIFKHSVQEKKEKLKYVCDTYHVCREYPAFTDYCADIISEVLKLNDKKFAKFLEIITKIVKFNDMFLATISEKEDSELIITKLKSFSSDLFGMKEFLAVLRAVITQRFKAVPSHNEKIKIRTKAMRILLDIIDKALSTEEGLLAIDFDNSVSALRSWAVGVREDIDDIFEDFAKNLLRMLEYNLTKNARKEMKVLIKTIMRGPTEEDEIYKYLFKYGSRYVKGEDFHPLLDF